MILLSSCAPTSVTPTGTRRYESLPWTEDVAVFTNTDEVQEPFQTIGLISHNDPEKYQSLTIGDATPARKGKARSIGANGVIIDQSTPVTSGIISTGISVTARAIYIQRPSPLQTPPQPKAQPQSQAYWYYCQSAKGYYPNVQNCPGAWIPGPPQEEAEHPRRSAGRMGRMSHPQPTMVSWRGQHERRAMMHGEMLKAMGDVTMNYSKARGGTGR